MLTEVLNSIVATASASVEILTHIKTDTPAKNFMHP